MLYSFSMALDPVLSRMFYKRNLINAICEFVNNTPSLCDMSKGCIKNVRVVIHDEHDNSFDFALDVTELDD